MAILGIILCLALLIVPGLMTFGVMTRLDGIGRVIVILVLFVLPAWIVYQDHDCNVNAVGAIDGPCDINDLLAFWSLIFGASALIGTIAGAIFNHYSRLQAETPDE